MLYSAYAFYINRLGRNTGFEDELTSYCFRLELHFVRRRVRLFSPNTFHDLGTRRTCTVPQTLRRRLQCPLSSTVDVGFPPQSIGPSQLSADDGEESTTASTVPTPVAPGATDAAPSPEDQVIDRIKSSSSLRRTKVRRPVFACASVGRLFGAGLLGGGPSLTPMTLEVNEARCNVHRMSSPPRRVSTRGRKRHEMLPSPGNLISLAICVICYQVLWALCMIRQQAIMDRSGPATTV
jgi:hypothetical protein